MAELIAFFTLGALIVGTVLLAGLVLKLLLKIALFPVWLGLGLVKVVVGLVAGVTLAVLGVVVAPILIVVCILVGLPLLAILALCGVGCTLVTA